MPKPNVNQVPKNVYDNLQEHFSDTFETHLNPWSASVTFGLRATKPSEKNDMTLRVRMPLEQVKALSLMLLNGIREYEGKTGVTVGLPEQLIKELKIAPEDWNNFFPPMNGVN